MWQQYFKLRHCTSDSGCSLTSKSLHTHMHILPPHSAVPRLLRYFLKVIFQTLNLLWVILVYTKKPSHVLVQVHTCILVCDP